MKTTFGPGVIVTSKFLNGAQEIFFDGLDLDWHYPPINIDDIQRGGDTGLDSLYVTLGTDQVFGGTPVTGSKSFMGLVSFGDSVSALAANAPKSWSTGKKFNQGGPNQTFSSKYAHLDEEDIITKEVLTERVDNFPIIDEGLF